MRGAPVARSRHHGYPCNDERPACYALAQVPLRWLDFVALPDDDRRKLHRRCPRLCRSAAGDSRDHGFGVGEFWGAVFDSQSDDTLLPLAFVEVAFAPQAIVRRAFPRITTEACAWIIRSAGNIVAIDTMPEDEGTTATMLSHRLGLPRSVQALASQVRLTVRFPDKQLARVLADSATGQTQPPTHALAIDAIAAVFAEHIDSLGRPWQTRGVAALAGAVRGRFRERVPGTVWERTADFGPDWRGDCPNESGGPRPFVCGHVAGGAMPPRRLFPYVVGGL